MLKDKTKTFLYILKSLHKRYVNHRVSHAAAGLTYYMLFTLFPLIIFAYSIISLLNIPIDEILEQMSTLLPADIVELLLDYLSYVGGMSRTFMLYAGSVLAIYMLFKFITSLNYAVRKAGGAAPLRSWPRFIMSLLASCSMMLTILVLLILFSITRNIYHYIALFFELSGWVKIVADTIRYAAGPVVLFFVLTFYYHVLDDNRQTLKKTMPGAFFAVLIWYVFSLAFVVYVNHFGRYTNLYGSLASIMVLMIWFHTTASAFIIGAEINAVLRDADTVSD